MKERIQTHNIFHGVELFILITVSVILLFHNAQGQTKRPTPATSNTTYNLQIKNKSDFRLISLSLRKTTKPKLGRWGVNQFSEGVLNPHGTLTLTDIPSGEYDVKILRSLNDPGCVIGKLNLQKNMSRVITNACWNQGKIEVPEEYTQTHQAIVQGKPFEFNEANMLFMGGMANYILEVCEMPENYQERLTFRKFVLSSGLMATLGNSYSNPDFGKQIKGATIYAAGSKVVESMGCSDATKLLSENIVRAIKSNATNDDGKVSEFIKTCTPYHSESKCQCLADAGRAVIPNIHQQTYDRDIIKAIIAGNPFVGLQIVAQCGIINY